jgi:(1->4)-alpha-D-glucan 1-alpha-D-glucosylmutase
MTILDLSETLLEKVSGQLCNQQHFPEATYRLQFHAGFTFRDAHRLAPYLHELGITDCYASPYLKAKPGSQHGYDIQDHRSLNPQIGSEEDYNAWVEALHAHGMGQILDVVPNHMGIGGSENAWWYDVLENGPSSPYAGYFDIDWNSYTPRLLGKVLLPFLGKPYGIVLEAGELTLHYEAGAFAIHYFEHRFPVAPCSYAKILSLRVAELEQRLGKEAPEFVEYQSILTAIGHLPPRGASEAAHIEERGREKEVIKRRLGTLSDSCPAVREFILQNVASFNGQVGDVHSFDLLDELLNEQAYRLSTWHVASDEINYRRFFDVNELAALSMERPEVFAATHELIFRLLREGKVNGLRIDHPDGLYNPKQYLERLQQQFVLQEARKLAESDAAFDSTSWDGLEPALVQALPRQATPDSSLWRPLYVIVEKILAKGEALPEDWPVYGTTGYEFLNALNGLFVEADHAQNFTRIYRLWTKCAPAFRNVVYSKKFLILQVSLSGELHMLAQQLDRLAQAHRWSRDFTLNSLRHALREIIACFPVYRSYISEEGVTKRDQFYVAAAVARARRKNPAISASIFDFVRDVLLLKGMESAGPEELEDLLRFAGKFQQVTSPVMAKGVEDTAFYTYNRLLSLNEVGGDPDQFGATIQEFHGHNRERQQRWPRALSATSTHDTKRSEDVRARLNVLSELPRQWQKSLSRWNLFNKRHRVPDNEQVVPDRNEEYLLYQTLVGAWPLEPYSQEDYDKFVQRIQAYMQKAIHEAKEHTSWINPNPAHDDAVRTFVSRILDARKNRRFIDDVREFVRRISDHGMFNSLSQTLLKIALPGVPDIYQGTELWDFSLVDPDNRRPVDYELRAHYLQELQESAAQAGSELWRLARTLVDSRVDGRIKLYLTYQALRCRRSHPGLFSEGEYFAAETAGAKSEQVFAFARRLKGASAVVAVPRLVTRLMPQSGDLPLGPSAWQDTILRLPAEQDGHVYKNIFTGETLAARLEDGKETLALRDVLANFPVALLLAQE